MALGGIEQAKVIRGEQDESRTVDGGRGVGEVAGADELGLPGGAIGTVAVGPVRALPSFR